MIMEDKWVEVRWIVSEQYRENIMAIQRRVILLEGLLLLIDFKIVVCYIVT